MTSSLLPGSTYTLKKLTKKPSFNSHVVKILPQKSLSQDDKDEADDFDIRDSVGRIQVEVQGCHKARMMQKMCIKVKPINLYPCAPRDRDVKKVLISDLDADFVSWVLRESWKNYNFDIIEMILTMLQIKQVKCPDEVSVDSFSSHAQQSLLNDYNFKPESTLEPGEESCWISGRHRRDGNPEWITYNLSPDKTLRRVDYVSMSIPVLPQGPLSVRNFKLEYSEDCINFKSHPDHNYDTLDCNGLQEFAVIPPIEASKIKLVCCTNAALDSQLALGFWQIHFS